MHGRYSNRMNKNTLAFLTLWPMLAWTGMTPVLAATATVILYEDREPDAAPYLSRILVQAGRMRMDYGRDDDDYILFDGRSVHLVSHGAAGITTIPAGKARSAPGMAPRSGVQAEPGGAQRLVRVTADGGLCAEFRSAPLLEAEMSVLRAFRQALAANQGVAWEHTPAELRDPCDWVMDTQEAGVEYRYGLLLSIRYANGRSRVYKGHEQREVANGLFELPAGYRRITLSTTESADGPR